MLDLFTSILCQQSDKSVNIQLLQTANLLIHNLADEASKDFLIKSEFYSEIISQPFDFSDSEIIENYTSFLKGLSVNISRAQMIEVIKSKHFTLFTAAMMFFNYPDSLVKTASRTVILNILKRKFYVVNESSIDEFILESGFFYNLINSIRESIGNIQRNNNISISKLEELVFDTIDTMYFVNDIISQNNNDFNEKIYNIMINALVLPVLASSLITEKIHSHHVSIPIALYILTKIIEIINFRKLVQQVISLMFAPEILNSFIKILKEPPTRECVFLDNSENTSQNLIFDNICMFLKCRDDNLIVLSLNLLSTSLSCPYMDEDFLQKIFPDDSIYLNFMSLIGEIIISDSNYRFITYLIGCKALHIIYNIAGMQSPRIERQILKNALIKYSDILIDLSRKMGSFIKTFKEQWNYIEKINLNEKPNIPIHFIKSSIDENALNIVLDNRQCLNDNEINIIELRLFLLFRKVMILLFFQNDAKANSFPLNDFYECSIKENESYPHDDNFFKFKPVFKVKLRENKGFYERILIKDDKFLVVVMNDPYTNSFYRVDILVVFSKISINDKSEPKHMSF